VFVEFFNLRDFGGALGDSLEGTNVKVDRRWGVKVIIS